MSTESLVGLFDRDVFLKLACCDLWDTSIQALGISHAFRLPSCSVTGCERVVKRWIFDEAERAVVMARIAQMVSTTQLLDEDITTRASSDELYVELANTAGIDAGEALLVAILRLAEDPTSLVTGDKRFVRALMMSFPDLFSLIKSRILTFETCVLAACNLDGHESVISRIRKGAVCDKTLQLALGTDSAVSAATFVEALKSFNPIRVGV